MGASISIMDHIHIHISLSTKFIDSHKIVTDMIRKLEEKTIKVTVTNNELSTKEIYDVLSTSNIIFYCHTQNYSSCSPTQAIEYNHLSNMQKPVYDIIIDHYPDKVFTEHMQYVLDGYGWEIESANDIQNLLREIQVKYLMAMLYN